MSGHLHPLPPYSFEKPEAGESFPRLVIMPHSPHWNSHLMYTDAPEWGDTIVEALEDIRPAPVTDIIDRRPMLRLKPGDKVKVLRRWTGDKWMGVRLKDDVVGWFILDARVRPVLNKSTYVLWDYTARREEELSFNGGVIEVLDILDGWWFLGASGDNVGLVPFNYVVPTVESNKPLDPSEELRFTLTGFKSQNIHDFSFEKGETIMVLKQWKPDRWVGRMGEKIGLFDPLKTGRCLTWGPNYVRVVWSYEPMEDNELNLTEGELIEVIWMAEDWWLGRTKSGEEGLFPSNYVEPVLDRRMREFE